MDFKCPACKSEPYECEADTEEQAHPVTLEPALYISIYCHNYEEELAWIYVKFDDMHLTDFAEQT